MAVLFRYCTAHQRVENTVDVQNATTMGYAAMHVAEAAGFDPGKGRWYLSARGGEHISPDDLAADWDGQETILCNHGGAE